MGYTKIKKLNDSFECLNSLAYSEDFLREYDNFCNLADSLYKNKTTPNLNQFVPDTKTLFGYVNHIVIPVIQKLPEFESRLSFEEQGLNEKTSLKRDVFSTVLFLLDEFRTVDWAKVKGELMFFHNLKLVNPL